LKETWDAYIASDRVAARAADVLGRSASTVKEILKECREKGFDEKTVSFPAFVDDGDEHEPIEDLLGRLEKGFNRKHRNATAKRWFEVKVNETKPYGILMFGDPHLGDDGCNMPLLQKHLAIARKPGVYGLNIGDTTNNWVGRLMRLYAEQETSAKTEKRLAEWFMFDAGVSWLCWVLGNHDDWNGGADFQKRLGGKHIPIIDWRAQFRLTHKGETEAKIDASHGRKGSSIWNNLHATLRAAKLGENADLYVTGHTHNFGLEDLEIAEKGISTWLVQLRGYKWHDHYALTGNWAEHQRGASVLAIVDPRADARRRVTCFEDVEFGYNVLEWMRS
jgi:hypothetical protein